MNEDKDGQLNIELDEQTAQGVYSNLAVVNHSNSEFVLDFINVMPGLPKAKVRSRVIIAPEHAKRLLQALQENLMKYESEFGEVNENRKNLNITPLGKA